MIRLFAGLCKSLLETIVDIDIFQAATDSFSYCGKPCPHCGARGKLKSHGDYERGLAFFKWGKTASSRVRPLRFMCASCGRTHALLPDILVPYSPYSLRFKLAALIAYYERETTVTEVCGRFEIAVSTIYEWKKLLLSHKELLLGVFFSQKEPALSFLRSLIESGCLSGTLSDFFARFGFSFMQRSCAGATRSRPP